MDTVLQIAYNRSDRHDAEPALALSELTEHVKTGSEWYNTLHMKDVICTNHDEWYSLKMMENSTQPMTLRRFLMYTIGPVLASKRPDIVFDEPRRPVQVVVEPKRGALVNDWLMIYKEAVQSLNLPVAFVMPELEKDFDKHVAEVEKLAIRHGKDIAKTDADKQKVMKMTTQLKVIRDGRWRKHWKTYDLAKHAYDEEIKTRMQVTKEAKDRYDQQVNEQRAFEDARLRAQEHVMDELAMLWRDVRKTVAKRMRPLTSVRRDDVSRPASTAGVFDELVVKETGDLENAELKKDADKVASDMRLAEIEAEKQLSSVELEKMKTHTKGLKDDKGAITSIIEKLEQLNKEILNGDQTSGSRMDEKRAERDYLNHLLDERLHPNSEVDQDKRRHELENDRLELQNLQQLSGGSADTTSLAVKCATMLSAWQSAKLTQEAKLNKAKANYTKHWTGVIERANPTFFNDTTGVVAKYNALRRYEEQIIKPTPTNEVTTATLMARHDQYVSMYTALWKARSLIPNYSVVADSEDIEEKRLASMIQETIRYIQTDNDRQIASWQALLSTITDAQRASLRDEIDKCANFERTVDLSLATTKQEAVEEAMNECKKRVSAVFDGIKDKKTNALVEWRHVLLDCVQFYSVQTSISNHLAEHTKIIFPIQQSSRDGFVFDRFKDYNVWLANLYAYIVSIRRVIHRIRMRTQLLKGQQPIEERYRAHVANIQRDDISPYADNLLKKCASTIKYTSAYTEGVNTPIHTFYDDFCRYYINMEAEVFRPILMKDNFYADTNMWWTIFTRSVTKKWINVLELSAADGYVKPEANKPGRREGMGAMYAKLVYDSLTTNLTAVGTSFENLVYEKVTMADEDSVAFIVATITGATYKDATGVGPFDYKKHIPKNEDGTVTNVAGNVTNVAAGSAIAFVTGTFGGYAILASCIGATGMALEGARVFATMAGGVAGVFKRPGTGVWLYLKDWYKFLEPTGVILQPRRMDQWDMVLHRDEPADNVTQFYVFYHGTYLCYTGATGLQAQEEDMYEAFYENTGVCAMKCDINTDVSGALEVKVGINKLTYEPLPKAAVPQWAMWTAQDDQDRVALLSQTT
jgi:hypothetical protein